LLHISEVDWKRLENLDGILKEGDEVEVKLLEVDKKTGKMRLSRKALIPRPERTGQEDEEQPERRERFDRPSRPDRRDKPYHRR